MWRVADMRDRGAGSDLDGCTLADHLLPVLSFVRASSRPGDQYCQTPDCDCGPHPVLVRCNAPANGNSFALASHRQCVRKVSPGILHLLIFKTLVRLGPIHGYGMAMHIQQTTEGVLQVEEGSLYPLWSGARQDAILQTIPAVWPARCLVEGAD